MEWLITIIAAAGIPTAITGLLFRHLEKRMDEKDRAREQHEYLIVKSINASMALGEATAEAVQRIPDAHCNGDMHAALEYARKVKHEQKDFLNKQAVHSIMQ
ncbi:MAG TPA: serine/threonine protein kinase [Candidatus Mediterraneibacter intestinipullorum]|nr:serine/threonine protein kinase [Candidatus Mediterraneibacter intestinipullorum]